MTRKDFELIAAALNDSANSLRRLGRHDAAMGVEDAAVVLSRRLLATNRAFDPARFLTAAGVEY
jgi:hypothetical protein